MIAIEEGQLSIIRDARAKIFGDKADETIGAVGRAGSDVEMTAENVAGAIGSIAAGDFKSAALQGFLAMIGFSSARENIKRVDSEIAEGGDKMKTMNSMLKQRVEFINKLKSNPAMCNDNVKAQLYLNYVRDTKALNEVFISFVRDHVSQMQPGVYMELQVSGGTFVVAGIASLILLKYAKNTLWIFPATTTVLTMASGVYLGKKLLVDLPLLNGLKSDILEMEQKNKDLAEREAKLKAQLGMP